MGLARDVPSPAKGGVRPCPIIPGSERRGAQGAEPPSPPQTPLGAPRVQGH